MEKHTMKSSRISLMVLVLVLLAFAVATPTAFAQALSGDGGGSASTGGWSPLAVLLGAAGAAIATVASASFYLHRR